MASDRKRARRRAWRARARARTRRVELIQAPQFARECLRWSKWLAQLDIDDGTLGDQLNAARELARAERAIDQLELRAQILRTQGQYGGELIDRVLAIVDTSTSAFAARTVGGRVTWLWDGDSADTAERMRASWSAYGLRKRVRRGE